MVHSVATFWMESLAVVEIAGKYQDLGTCMMPSSILATMGSQQKPISLVHLRISRENGIQKERYIWKGSLLIILCSSLGGILGPIGISIWIFKVRFQHKALGKFKNFKAHPEKNEPWKHNLRKHLELKLAMESPHTELSLWTMTCPAGEFFFKWTPVTLWKILWKIENLWRPMKVYECVRFAIGFSHSNPRTPTALQASPTQLDSPWQRSHQDEKAIEILDGRWKRESQTIIVQWYYNQCLCQTTFSRIPPNLHKILQHLFQSAPE